MHDPLRPMQGLEAIEHLKWSGQITPDEAQTLRFYLTVGAHVPNGHPMERPVMLLLLATTDSQSASIH